MSRTYPCNRQHPASELLFRCRALINNINRVVHEKDELWILGDFSFRIKKEQAAQLRNAIVCRHIHLVSGNHDEHYQNTGIFESVQDYKELRTCYGKLVLFHNPIWEWNDAYAGAIHLHGHIHSIGSYNAENLHKTFRDRFPAARGKQFAEMGLYIYDVGVDANNFTPISLEQLAAQFHLRAKETE